MAGMLPIDDMSAADMLAWVRWDQHLQPLDGPVREVPVPGRYRRFDQLQPCGTYAAFRRHEDRGELIDDACWAAARVYWAGRKRRRAGRPARLAPCGTYAAYRRHKRRGEPVDEECGEALRVYSRETKRTQRGGQAAAGM
jgi:hypothetical protein